MASTDWVVRLFRRYTSCQRASTSSPHRLSEKNSAYTWHSVSFRNARVAMACCSSFMLPSAKHASLLRAYLMASITRPSRTSSMNSWIRSLNSSLLFIFLSLERFSSHHASAAAQSWPSSEAATRCASRKTPVSTSSSTPASLASFSAEVWYPLLSMWSTSILSRRSLGYIAESMWSMRTLHLCACTLSCLSASSSLRLSPCSCDAMLSRTSTAAPRESLVEHSSSDLTTDPTPSVTANERARATLRRFSYGTLTRGVSTASPPMSSMLRTSSSLPLLLLTTTL
mmetsp:Transcript_22648/g.70339  ORF Transcript_22648/g.70339 Transcript_22648/m.70339 type:complete len:284 (+) Transcript_22648:324-1175(+)